MKKILIKNLIKVTSISLICSVLCINANASKALDGVYLKAGVGGMGYEKFKFTGSGYGEKSPKGDPVYNVGIGYKFTNAMRADLNLQYTHSKYSESGATTLKQNIKTIAAFVNGYYDINLHKVIVPYITAGIGVGQNKTGDISVLTATAKGRTQNNFIWNAGAGIQCKFNKNFALDLGYRYIDLGYIKTDSVTVTPPGLTFNFGKQKLRGHQVIGSLVYSL